MKEYLLPFVAVAKDALGYYTLNFENNEKFHAFLISRGWIPDDGIDISAVGDIDSFVASIESVVEKFDDLKDGLGYDDLDQIVSIFEDIKVIYEFIDDVISLVGSFTLYPLNQTDFWNELKDDFFDTLLVRYIAIEKPFMYAGLRIADIIEAKKISPVGAKRLDYTNYEIHWDKLGQLVTDPKGLFEDAYKWGDSVEEFDYQKFMSTIEEVHLNLGIETVKLPPTQDLTNAYLDPMSIESQDITGLDFKLINNVDPLSKNSFELGYKVIPIYNSGGNVPDGFAIIPNAEAEETLIVPLTHNVSLFFDAAFASRDSVRIKYLPDEKSIDFTGDVFVEGAVGFAGYFEDPYILLGRKNSTRVELEGFEAGVGVKLDQSESDIYIKLSTGISNDDGLQNGINFVVNTGESDSFIKKVLGLKNFEFKTSAELIWSSKNGVSLSGATGLEILIPTYEVFNGFSLADTKVRLGIASGLTYAEVVTDINLDFGPFAGTVSEIGLKALMKKADVPKETLLGNLDFDFNFRPPSGIGFVIDAAAFKGGGFLSFDYEQERYVGALELSVKDKVALKVIGILTTKLPGNGEGYSLLLLITAEFEPINLGFGFKLSGVGGLIALNRTMNLNYLRDGVKSNTLDNILFPQDPIQNINQIISDLEGAFPVQEGRYAFGPMAIIEWGTPTLITVELGLMIEVPSPVKLAILGVLKAILPAENKELLKLQVNFLGAIDFEAKFITFDASIFESKLLSFTLEGDMAFRLKYGDNKNFLFSIGGFHPAYTPPPLQLPALKRLTINLINGDNPRLTLTSYFAVTSNTVQFGSVVDFYYKISDKWSVIGYLGFDILIQFNPFYLNAAIAAQLALMRNGEAVVGIYLGGSVAGPAPWHVKGKAEITICGITLGADFDKTFGQPEVTTLPDIDVLPKLEEALTNKANWQVNEPENGNLLVTMRELDNAPGNVVAHPFGALGVSQKVVPLNTVINKFGTQRPADFQKFGVELSDANDNPFSLENLNESFAPAEYFQMSDSQKLSRNSFEDFYSGVSIAGTGEVKSSYMMERDLEFEQVILDSRDAPEYEGTVLESAMTFQAFTKNGTAAKSRLGSKTMPKSANAPAKVGVNQETFAIANTEDLTQYNSLQAGSEAEAQVLLEELLASDPALTDQIQVIPLYEVA